MTIRTLIVLFGHENDASGRLSLVAKLRCDRAIALADAWPAAMILPTGAFGSHFNASNRPHHRYLTEYLIANGIRVSRMLPGTSTSNTLEDVLAVRRRALDGGLELLHLVSSDYHIPRIEYIAERLLPEIGCEYHVSPVPDEERSRLEALERKSFGRLRAEWVIGPLYHPGGAFPTDVYSSAGNDQRHYDSLSLAVITAMIVVAAYASAPSAGDAASRNDAPWCDEGVRKAISAGLVTMLFILYDRLAHWARSARRMLRFIELGFDQRGFSSNFAPLRRFGEFPSVWWWVFILAFFLTGVLTVSAVDTFISCRW
jgi:uncharacterized SAM-binding protein YcdF (DUF218 family)